MTISQQSLRFFLSSTSVDLKTIRKEIIRFLEVLPADLVAMEFFGSDEAKPKEYCLEQLSRSNFFIGVYAERYGTIDRETGYSITELEYRQAAQMFRDGKMSSILIYLIDEDEANWPIKYFERTAAAIRKLQEFKELLKKNHVVTFFRTETDLPFLILKDVLKKMGVGKRTLRARPSAHIEKANVLTRPIGMESFGATQSLFFRGRDAEIERLLSQLVAERFSLVIGASGVGKSSLIQAGLLPRLLDFGWRVAILRPIPPVLPNLSRHLWGQLMEGPAPPNLGFAGIIKACVHAHEGAKLAIVLDQFEDILASRAVVEMPELLSELVDLRNSADFDARLLFSYRADVEAKVGPIWQLLSGSPGGLARVYLGPLSRSSAATSFWRILEAIISRVHAYTAYERTSLANSVIVDLEAESLANGFDGVFPPFLQMVITELTRATDQSAPGLLNQYRAAGSARKIISDFLLSQLHLLGNDEQVGRKILISLVSSQGAKSQKSASEIAEESSQEIAEIERVMGRLLDLRLVRDVQGNFEVIHDFLAHRITDEIVDSEQKEAKQCQELLRSRASTFSQTTSLLSYSEHLYVYRFRERISVSEDDVHYLFLSALANRGPIFYWLSRVSPSAVSSWLSETNITLDAFRSVTLARDVMQPELPRGEPGRPKSLIPLVVYDNPAVRQKAREELIEISKTLDDKWVRSLAASTSAAKRTVFLEICEKLSKGLSHDQARRELREGPIAHRARAAMALVGYAEESDLDALIESARNSTSRKMQFDLGFAAVRLATKLQQMTRAIDLVTCPLDEIARGAIAGARDGVGSELLRAIVRRGDRWPDLVGTAVARLATADDLEFLRRCLDESSQRYDAALFRNDALTAIFHLGGPLEVNLVLSRIKAGKVAAPLTYSAEVFEAAAAKMTPALKAELRSTIRSDPLFWHEVDRGGATRSGPSSSAQAGVMAGDLSGRYYLRWFVGTTFSFLADRSEREILFTLLRHSYWQVSKAAARRLIDVLEIGDLSRVVDVASATQETDITRDLLEELDARFYS